MTIRENGAGTPAATSSFNQLLKDKQILAALDALGLETPTPVQEASLPAALSGRDLVVQAQTGSGKTLAFVLPIVSELKAKPSKHVTAALIVTPTRELALQVREVIASLKTGIEPACIIGGASFGRQIAELNKDCRIVVGTPGRLRDLIERREILLRHCTQFVLDEADEMLSMGFIDEVRFILSKLPRKRQGLFFSATITTRVDSLAHSFLKDPQRILIESSEEFAPDIEHFYCNVGVDVAAKARALCNLIEKENPRSAIVFCNTKSDTELVEVFLRRRSFDARRINSDLSQKERSQIMQQIRDRKLQILIATDVAARGIDIAHIDLVVNYSIHDQPETYVHRTGRTGRAGRSGRAVSLIGPQDLGAFRGLRQSLDIELKEILVAA